MDETVPLIQEPPPEVEEISDSKLKRRTVYQRFTGWWDESLDKRNEQVTELKSRVKYYMPIISWLPKYEKRFLLNDILAGLTVGIMLVPQSLAYSNFIGISPIFGLHTGFFPLIIYTILGNSKQGAIGPEALITIMITQSLNGMGLTDPWSRANAATAMALMVGIFTFILGLFRFGFLSHLLSRPLLAGFINAVALEVIFSQLDKFLGITTGEHGIRVFPALIAEIKNTNVPSLILGLSALFTMLSIKWIKTKLVNKSKLVIYIPEIVIVVATSMLLTQFLHLEKVGIQILGEVEKGFLSPALPSFTFTDLKNLAPPSLLISVVGIVESLLVANMYAMKHGYRVSANRELVALGAANLLGSFFRIFPCFISVARSSINNAAGATTQFAGFVAAIIVGFTITVLLPFFKVLPNVVMAAIIVNAALGLIEFHDILFLWKIKAWPDLLLSIATFVITLVFGVELGITGSIILSLFFMIKHITMPHVVIFKRSPESRKLEEVELIRDVNLFKKKHSWFNSNSEVAERGVLIIRIEGALFFANINQIRELFQKIEAMSHSSLNGIVFIASNIPHFDAMAVEVMAEMLQDWKNRSIEVCFVKLRTQNKDLFAKAGIVDLIGPDKFFSKTEDAVNFILGGEHLSFASYRTYQLDQFLTI